MTLRAEFSEKQNVLRTVTFSAEAECDVAILTDGGTEIALAQGTNKVFVKDGETGYLYRARRLPAPLCFLSGRRLFFGQSNYGNGRP